MAKRTRPLEERFFEKIEYDTNGGCWLWSAYVTPLGYGKVGIGRGVWLAHRAAWLLFRGDPENLCVCHRCDVPACCNPDHLFLGTKADNSADMVAKGRSTAGEKTKNAKLTEDDVKAILRLRDCALSQPQIAERFGVSQSLVSAIHLGKRWAHITCPTPSTSPS